MSFNYTDAFLTIATPNLEKAISFYSKLLNREPKPYIPHVYAEFKLKSLRLAIFKPKEDNEAEFNDSRHSGMSICVEVEDLTAAIQHLTEMGYSPEGDIKEASHGREIYAYDPMNNRLILHQALNSDSIPVTSD